MIEFILLGAVGIATAAGGLSAYRNRYSRIIPMRRAAIESAERRALIPDDIRAELDGSPEWWDQKYHQLSLETGARKVTGKRPNISAIERYRAMREKRPMEIEPVPYWLEGCECSKCRAASKAS